MFCTSKIFRAKHTSHSQFRLIVGLLLLVTKHRSVKFYFENKRLVAMKVRDFTNTFNIFNKKILQCKTLNVNTSNTTLSCSLLLLVTKLKTSLHSKSTVSCLRGRFKETKFNVLF